MPKKKKQKGKKKGKEAEGKAKEEADPKSYEAPTSTDKELALKKEWDTSLILINAQLTIVLPDPRGSHLYVTCRSICNHDKVFWSAKSVLDFKGQRSRAFLIVDF